MPVVIEISAGPLPPDLTPRLLTAVTRGFDLANQLAVGRIVRTRLNPGAPQPYPVSEHRLRHVTGRAAGSLAAAPAVLSGTTIEASIGSNVRYLKAHEFGFSGPVAVPSHTRRLTKVTRAGAEMSSKTGRIRKVKPRRIVTGQSTVKAHTRQAQIPERAPIRTGLADPLTREIYPREIQAAIAREFPAPPP